MRDEGALALVLHTHMPYVEGFGTWPFGEEWLWEAVATVYLPLLPVLRDKPVTVSLTPVLCDQLEQLQGEAGTRYREFLRGVRAEIHAEDAHHFDLGGHGELAAEVRRAAQDYVRGDEQLGDLLGAFAGLGAELWTSAATHALLPMLATEAGRALQLGTGVASHERRFGLWEGGFWLPECAYEPGLERDLAEHGVRRFCVDQTNLFGLGAPEHLEPVATEAGPVALPVDWSTVELVWSETSGYPADPRYRDYHRRTTHDLRPWNHSGDPYDHDAARLLAREHARDFVSRCRERLAAYARERGRPGVLTCALDTELLGHWWYEGPAWLEGVFEEASAQGLPLVTTEEAVEHAEPIERPLAASTWGTGKDFSTWDSPEVAELAFSVRRAELDTVASAAAGHGRDSLERAARELLAIQSSDWAFMLTRDLASDYPLRRVRAHEAAHAAALAGEETDPALRGLAPSLDVASLLAA